MGNMMINHQMNHQMWRDCGALPLNFQAPFSNCRSWVILVSPWRWHRVWRPRDVFFVEPLGPKRSPWKLSWPMIPIDFMGFHINRNTLYKPIWNSINSEIGYLDTAASLWNRLMQFWNCDAHLRDNPPFTSTSKSMGAFSEWTFTKKAGLVKFGNLLVLISWRLTDLAKKWMDPLIALLRECSKGCTGESYGYVATKLAGGPSFTVKVAGEKTCVSRRKCWNRDVRGWTNSGSVKTHHFHRLLNQRFAAGSDWQFATPKHQV